MVGKDRIKELTTKKQMVVLFPIGLGSLRVMYIQLIKSFTALHFYTDCDGYGVFMEAIQNVTEVRVGANVFVRDIAHGDDIVLLIKRQDKK